MIFRLTVDNQVAVLAKHEHRYGPAVEDVDLVVVVDRDGHPLFVTQPSAS